MTLPRPIIFNRRAFDTDAEVNVGLVKTYLPREAAELYGWDDDKIQAVLDEYGDSIAQILRRFWYERWSETTEYISISEAGTTRPLDQIHAHARDMLDYWEEKVGEEMGRKPISFGEIERPTEG